jgi:hypothetical protein
MNRPTLGEVKGYLGLDGDEQNTLLSVLISSAVHLVEKVLRRPIAEDDGEVVKNAILFAVWQLYFYRDSTEFDAATLESKLATMLSDIRRVQF